MLTKLKIKLINHFFNKYYSKFEYPFESADYLLNKLPKNRREQYFYDINNWINSEAYKIETTELKKELYRDLALKTSSDISRAGYRLALILKRNEENRLKSLAARGVFEEKVDKIINT